MPRHQSQACVVDAGLAQWKRNIADIGTAAISLHVCELVGQDSAKPFAFPEQFLRGLTLDLRSTLALAHSSSCCHISSLIHRVVPRSEDVYSSSSPPPSSMLKYRSSYTLHHTDALMVSCRGHAITT